MPRKSRKNVGLIGLGIIGSRVAAGLRSAGFQSFVWNRTPRPAPNFLGSAAEVAEICDIIQLFVSDGAAVRDVIESMGEQITARHIIINCATIGPEATVEAAEMVQARGGAFLDAPFTGSKGAAEKSQLVYYVGGDESVFQAALPVLEATSRAIVRCGRVGDAAILKLATNLISAAATQTLAEALALVRAAGIPGENLAAAIEHNACKSGVIELKLPKMMSGDYEAHFSAKHMFKDVQLGIHLANVHKLELPVTTVAGGVLYGALCQGWGDLDFASVYKIYSDAPKAREQVPSLPSPSVSESPAEGEAEGVVEAQWVEKTSASSDEPATTGKPGEPAVSISSQDSPDAVFKRVDILPPGVLPDDSEVDLRDIFKRVPTPARVETDPSPADESKAQATPEPQAAPAAQGGGEASPASAGAMPPSSEAEKPSVAPESDTTSPAPAHPPPAAEETRPAGFLARLFGKRNPAPSETGRPDGSS
jgi:3-hydroxyisobutyrate dehydrogenase-like beta-hydroxyacid dehydrogenase